MLQTRGYDPVTGRRPRVKGYGLAAALFRHVASRDLDPQLHTYAVVANMTRDAEGRWKRIEPTLIRRNARLIGAYYRNELSRRLIERGYSVVPAMAGRLQSFEIAGYDKALRDAFSTRRKQILAYIDEKGWERGEAEAQIAALATRKPKAEPLHGMLREIWAERASEFREVPSARRSRGRTVLPPVPTALEIAWRSVRQLEERQSVFAAGELEALALQHSPGRHSIEAVREAIGLLVRDAHLVEANLRRADRAYVTDRALKAERALIAMMRAGIGAGETLCGREAVEAHLAGTGLTDGRRPRCGRSCWRRTGSWGSSAGPGPARPRCWPICGRWRVGVPCWAWRRPLRRRARWRARRGCTRGRCNGSSRAAGLPDRSPPQAAGPASRG